jgi:hypothetical protein
MRKQVLAVVTMCGVALALTGGLASAAEIVSVDVPFSFFVHDEEMPAGHYEIRTQGDEETALLIESTTAGKMAAVQVITRLADNGSKESTVVFDKVEGKRYLSEVHIPATDGFLVGIAKGRETHEVLTGEK